MAQGLQIFDSSGTTILDTNTRNGLVLGNIEIGSSPYSGDISIPLGSTHTIWYLAVPYGDTYDNTAFINLTSSTVLHWEATLPCRLIYGVF
jgi:hypothetical protein